MPENPTSDPNVTTKRYAPLNQRKRSNGRRKSGGGRLERADSYSSEGERTSGVANGFPNADYVDSSHVSRSKLLSIHGCSNGEAFQLLRNRWTAAMDAYNSLRDDSPEKPVMYVPKSASAWGLPMLPHLIMHSAPAASTRVKKDFLSELRQAMGNANP